MVNFKVELTIYLSSLRYEGQRIQTSSNMCLIICVFGKYQCSNLYPAEFPIMLCDILKYEDYFEDYATLEELLNYLESSPITIEIAERNDFESKRISKAYFETSVRKLTKLVDTRTKLIKMQELVFANKIETDNDSHLFRLVISLSSRITCTGGNECDDNKRDDPKPLPSDFCSGLVDRNFWNSPNDRSIDTHGYWLSKLDCNKDAKEPNPQPIPNYDKASKKTCHQSLRALFGISNPNLSENCLSVYSPNTSRRILKMCKSPSTPVDEKKNALCNSCSKIVPLYSNEEDEHMNLEIRRLRKNLAEVAEKITCLNQTYRLNCNKTERSPDTKSDSKHNCNPIDDDPCMKNLSSKYRSKKPDRNCNRDRFDLDDDDPCIKYLGNKYRSKSSSRARDRDFAFQDTYAVRHRSGEFVPDIGRYEVTSTRKQFP